MEWLKKNFRQTVLIAFITAIFSTAAAIGGFYIERKQGKVDKAASIEYVNQQDSALNEKLCLHDTKFVRLEDKIDSKADKSDYVRLESKIDNMYNLLIKMANEK